MAVVRISDVVVPEIFTGYAQQITEEKSNLVASGALVRDPSLDEKLGGGGLTFNIPSWNDLANDEEDVVNDDPTDESSPKSNGSDKEVAVRMVRHQSWSSMRLAAVLAGADPADAIASRVAAYWTRRTQAAFVAVVTGIFNNNEKGTPGGGAVQNDLTRDVSGAAYVAGTTDFQASSFIDACVTMGDSMGDLTLVMVHSLVYARMQKNNLIDFVPDSDGKTQIATFLGRRIVMDDGVPFSGGVFETWLFGAGAIRWGVGTPPEATEVERDAKAGRGGGQDTLHNRVMWSLHPTGHKYAGTTSGGGPSNANTSNNLAHADSWERVYPERKQIKIARLITRES